jgi:hypothetical protein
MYACIQDTYTFSYFILHGTHRHAYALRHAYAQTEVDDLAQYTGDNTKLHSTAQHNASTAFLPVCTNLSAYVKS